MKIIIVESEVYLGKNEKYIPGIIFLEISHLWYRWCKDVYIIFHEVIKT